MFLLKELVLEPNKLDSYEVNILHILSYEKRRLRGIFYNPYCKKGARFESILGLFRLMSQWMDTTQVPQSTVLLRSFAKRKRSNWEREEIPLEYLPDKACGILETIKDWDKRKLSDGRATFIIRVDMRQNATWQGTLQWVDAERSLPFESGMDLLLLINGALESTPDSPWKQAENKGEKPFSAVDN